MLRHFPATITVCLFIACAALGRLCADIAQNREPIRDRFDKLEWNIVYFQESGDTRLTQLLGMDEGGTIQFWRLAKPGMKPRRDRQRGGWVSLFQDGDVLREIRASHFDETFDPVDYEVAQRAIVPECQRRGLTKREGIR